MRRVIVFAVLAAVFVLAVLLFWRWLAFAVLAAACLRALRGRRRRRSSFAANVQALAVLYAAWNSRWLKTSKLKASSYADPAERKAFERYGEVPF